MTKIIGQFHEIVQFGEKKRYFDHTDQSTRPMINNVNFLVGRSSTNATSGKGCQGAAFTIANAQSMW